MKTSTIEKLYIILDDSDETPVKKLDAFFIALLPHLTLTANIYVVAPALGLGASTVERIQKHIKSFLKSHRFTRYNLHFLHPLPQGSGPGDVE